ncbi:MAG: BlaI/MecI/CopY family transcriptional regulator [Patescibacteria group bacterium]|nr:BlaI/MecI/CopY family transcriptional regulator [Actinomycetota bacterium]MCL5438914.1 BlaI/MecI/CopY family transcriptional regulator [Patescibacteria group bacterium]
MNKKTGVTGKVLGELESKIMEIIWSQKKAVSVKDVTEILEKRRRIAYTTVMTIMVRLANKGILVRYLSGQSYLYKPKGTKDQFMAKAVHGIFSSAVSTLGEEVLTHFVKEIQKISPKKRQQLLKILDED